MKERVSKVSNTILEATIWFSLAIPIFIISVLKLIVGTMIGLWAYSVAKAMPAKPAKF